MAWNSVCSSEGTSAASKKVMSTRCGPAWRYAAEMVREPRMRPRPETEKLTLLT